MILGLVAAVLVLAVGYLLYMEFIGNPHVAREIAENADGERARKAASTLLAIPFVPVFYVLTQQLARRRESPTPGS